MTTQVEPPVEYGPVNIDSCKALKRKLSSVISSCRICLSTVFEPACLTDCGHKFCEQCLNTYWHVNEKPDVIVCPLCRGRSSDIAFVLKEEPVSSTTDLRRTFDVVEKANSIKRSSLCLKVMMIPILYWIVNWLKNPVLQLFTFFHEMFKGN